MRRSEPSPPCRCLVEGHGTGCIVASEIRSDKKHTKRRRLRRVGKQLTSEGLDEWIDSLDDFMEDDGACPCDICSGDEDARLNAMYDQVLNLGPEDFLE